MVSKKDFCYELLQTLTERNKNQHEISMQNAVMSWLEDVNSSQFFTRSNMNNLRGHSLKLYKEHFHKVDEYSKFGSNLHKNVVSKELLNK